MKVNDDYHERIQRVEGLLLEIERFEDDHARDTAREAVQLLMELTSVGLARMLELAPPSVLEAFGRDDLVASLLLLYDLHPLGTETRVRAALDTVRPFLRSHKADVEFVSLLAGELHLRLIDGVGPALARAVEEAVYAAAPDVRSVTIDGSDEPDDESRFPLPMFGST